MLQQETQQVKSKLTVRPGRSSISLEIERQHPWVGSNHQLLNEQSNAPTNCTTETCGYTDPQQAKVSWKLTPSQEGSVHISTIWKMSSLGGVKAPTFRLTVKHTNWLHERGLCWHWPSARQFNRNLITGTGRHIDIMEHNKLKTVVPGWARTTNL